MEKKDIILQENDIKKHLWLGGELMSFPRIDELHVKKVGEIKEKHNKVFFIPKFLFVSYVFACGILVD